MIINYYIIIHTKTLKLFIFRNLEKVRVPSHKSTAYNRYIIDHEGCSQKDFGGFVFQKFSIELELINLMNFNTFITGTDFLGERVDPVNHLLNTPTMSM